MLRLFLGLLVGGIISADLFAGDLAAGFRTPPADARPHVWWHWMNGNVSKEGITADLEAMARIGIGGAQIFDAGCDIPVGPVEFGSEEWYDLLLYAAREARRLGLELCLSNCSGWANSGGPWVTPEMGMKCVVWTEKLVNGPQAEPITLEQPENPHGFYRDIAVLAFPTPVAELQTMEAAGGVVSQPSHTQTLIEFPTAFTAAGLTCRFDFDWYWTAPGKFHVETSDDGVNFEWREMFDLQLAPSGDNDHNMRYLAFTRPYTAKVFRLTTQFPLNPSLVAKDVSLQAGLRIPDLPAKTFKVRAAISPCTAEATAEMAVAKSAVRDITASLQADGRLDWKVPDGNWTILRIGYAATGRKNQPASAKGEGLEIDKLSKVAADLHFEAYIGEARRRLGSLAGPVKTGFNNMLIDSYEAGAQNWTQGFEREFAARKGYAITPYLPVLTGHIIGSMAESERFLEDYRRVIADLFAANYAGEMARKCREAGLKFSLEGYGSCPADNLQYGRYADIPMGEFWSGPGTGVPGVGNARFPAYLAHVWGQKYVATESFTAMPGGASGRWQKDPFGIKAQCDRVYTEGVNRIIYHRFTHQPWVDERYVPGMTMGKWGMHFDRTQTWWDLAKPWITYQTRCQYLLQEGKSVADALFFCGEDVPNKGGSLSGAEDDDKYELPRGYNWDVCAEEALFALTVKDGRLVAPSGVSYAMLILPDKPFMSLKTLERIGTLLESGAKVVGHTKPTRVYGLGNGADDDARLAKRVAEVWAKGVIEKTPTEALAQLGIKPDFTCADSRVAYCHRTDGRAADWYFVAMANEKKETVTCSFNVTGRIPELWNPLTGRIGRAPSWREENGRTVLDLTFQPSGSTFVMFRTKRKGPIMPTRAAKWVEISSRQIDGPWEVAFQKGRGAPERTTFPVLIDWAKHDAEGVRHFSGTAEYTKTVSVDSLLDCQRLILDLGEVKNFAEVYVNGRKLALCWKPPYAVDITSALKGAKTIDLKIKVTNLWPNRLIGDDALPADCKWRWADFGEAIAEIPDWVRKGESSPTGRHTFTTWKHWTKDDELLPSGLIGPVQLRTMGRSTAQHGFMLPARDCTEDDIRTLEAWGTKLVRFQIMRNWGQHYDNQDIEEYRAWVRGRIDYLKSSLLPRLRETGIETVIDLHVLPGGIRPDSDHVMFYDGRYADAFVEVWREIAQLCREESGIFGYDLVNEPCNRAFATGGYDWWALQNRAAQEIRTIDAKTPIIVEANLWDSPKGFETMKPLEVTNVIYQVHMYEPYAFTHQGVSAEHRQMGVAYPNAERGWNKDFLRNVLKPVRDFQLKNKARIYVGEFSAIAWAPGAEAYLADCISLFREYDWDWTYHAFREWEGWSLEHEGQGIASLRPSADNLRKRVVLKGLVE